MQIVSEVHGKKKATIEALRQDRYPWWSHWRELADYYLPRRYVWLMSDKERQVRDQRNRMVLDSTGTDAARTLASGMMNGVTSPSRPWFRLRIVGFADDESNATRIWTDEVTRRMLIAMAETNFYNAMALVYLDLSVFGTASSLIYEDYDQVFRCYNCPLGEYYIAQDSRQLVNTFAREFTYKVHQIVEEWGLENCSDTIKNAYKEGGAKLQQDYSIVHLIEPNLDGPDKVKGGFKFREFYWENKSTDGQILSLRGYYELPGIFPRWELTANDSYGSSPAMDALGDVIQLQHETKAKGKGLDKMIDPPLLADVQLAHKPISLMPRGITYVAGVNNVGVKPIYTTQLPLDMMTADMMDVRDRIRKTFHNDLFLMISQLDTVRSAAEIYVRKEEKLVLLGPVLERFENEALDPAIKRIFAIMWRAGLLPEPPPELEGADIEIQYVSVLTAAQTAVATIPTERWVGMIGQVSAVVPKALNIPNWDELLRNYGRDLGVRAKDMNDKAVTDELNAQQDAMVEAQEAANTGTALVDGAKTLSETDTGAGVSALQRLINPYTV